MYIYIQFFFFGGGGMEKQEDTFFMSFFFLMRFLLGKTGKFQSSFFSQFI